MRMLLRGSYLYEWKCRRGRVVGVNVVISQVLLLLLLSLFLLEKKRIDPQI